MSLTHCDRTWITSTSRSSTFTNKLFNTNRSRSTKDSSDWQRSRGRSPLETRNTLDVSQSNGAWNINLEPTPHQARDRISPIRPDLSTDDPSRYHGPDIVRLAGNRALPREGPHVIGITSENYLHDGIGIDELCRMVRSFV
ncbi:hypothetical protein BDV41DRAFT_413577 [Aspergillus transmontanensis]|uniref:Uncharacterized protein n=1 Tax=Aspergillus transmontanensis TaxID=1034304 RepID=A0A5N6WBH1_9EURO|nr:hypothetical protein BDV41DRAFT_413577 [Aspergillus transmontanensis]